MRTRRKTMENLIEYLKENVTTDELLEMTQSVNSYNGALDYLYYYENDEEFFETMFQTKDEVARAVCYGDYSYTDDYVKFNAYGNLESVNQWELEEELNDYKEEIIDEYLNAYEEDKEYFNDDVIKKIEEWEEERGEE